VREYYRKEQPLHDSLLERKNAEIRHLMELQNKVSECVLKEGLNHYITCRKIAEEYGYYLGARNYMMTGEDFWKPNHNIKIDFKEWDPSQAEQQIQSFPVVTAENPKKGTGIQVISLFPKMPWQKSKKSEEKNLIQTRLLHYS